METKMTVKQSPISVEYIDHSGSDLMVANAARTSFGKESTWDSVDGECVLKATDAKLINFLASGYRTEEWKDMLQEVKALAALGSDDLLSVFLRGFKRKAQHWAPFGHPHLTLRMTLPLFLARQFVKHQIGGTWSEESRRYMSSEPSFWFPDKWHTRPADIKQGSGDTVQYEGYVEDISLTATETALLAYSQLLEAGVAPEEARTVLTLNAMTTVTWTGSLLFWSRVVNQRTDGHA